MSEDTYDSGETPNPALAQYSEEKAKAVQDSLTHRPRISIRLRIAAGFLVAFMFTCGITVEPGKAAEVLIEKLGAKSHSLMEIQRGLLVAV